MENLTYLNLSRNPIGNSALISLGKSQAFPKLNEFWLERCGFTEEKALESFLKGKLARRLKILALNSNLLKSSVRPFYMKVFSRRI